MRTITPEELKEILRLHNFWLENKEGVIRVDLSYADLRYTNLSGVDLRYTNLSGVNIDYASLTFSCKTLNIITDDRIKIQYLYHVAKQNGEIQDSDLKKLMSLNLFKKVCNKFHRVEECGKIK